jgi:hypothetical protein
MHNPTATKLAVSILAALTTAAMAQPGGGGGRPGGGGGGGRQGGPPDPAQFIDRMMENDANGDGKLSADELPGRFAERLFENGDANKDGFLDRAELQTAFDGFAQRRQEGQRPGQTGEQDRQGRQGGADRRAPGSGGGAGGNAVAFNFETGMSQAGRALSGLRRSKFDDASRTSDLRLIQAVQSGLISAKSQAGNIPMAPQAEKRYGDDEVTYRSDFRLMMIQTIMETLALEAAVIEGDTAGAKESLEHLLAARSDSHDAFQPEEDDHDEHEEETAIPEPNRVRPGTTDRAPGRRGLPDSDA